MKKITILISSLALIGLVSCGPTKNDALKYNDHIMAILNDLNPVQTVFLDQLDGHNVDSLTLAQNLFSKKSKAGLDEISKFAPFAQKKEYLNASIEYFKTLNFLADNEGLEMTQIMTKDSTQITDEDITKMGELAEKFDSSYDKAFELITNAQSEFAKEWKFEIEKNHSDH